MKNGWFMSHWSGGLAAAVCAALMVGPLSSAFAQGRFDDEEAYEEDYEEGFGDEGEEYYEEVPEGEYDESESEDPGLDEEEMESGGSGLDRGERPVGINPLAPRWDWGPWVELRIGSNWNYPMGVYLARGRHEIGVGFLFLGGFVDPEDFDDPAVVTADSGYSALEFNYRYFLTAPRSQAQSGDGLWVGGGLSLASYDVDVETSDSRKGSASSNFTTVRIGAGRSWRSGNFELGVGLGLEYIPATKINVTASNSTTTKATSAEYGESNAYIGLSLGYRF